MKFHIVIPAHNEADFIGLTLSSLTNQSLLPKQVIVVNDNSTDDTAKVINSYTKEYDWIKTINTNSSKQHMPGAKVVQAFYKGYETLSDDFDIICKFDADIILPKNYLEVLAKHFTNNKNIGIAGGLIYIEKNNDWVYENITNKSHVRGPIKAYRKACFEKIGGLKPSIGWDTVDTLLAKFHNWEVKTIHNLKVKHLKPTGQTYNKASKYLQGEAMYKMRYGFWITLISAIKISFKRRSFNWFKNYIVGYFRAKSKKTQFLVSSDEGKFIRQLRWKGILSRLF